MIVKFERSEQFPSCRVAKVSGQQNGWRWECRRLISDLDLEMVPLKQRREWWGVIRESMRRRISDAGFKP